MKPINIKFKSNEDFFGDIKNAIKSNKSLLQKSDTIYFDDYKGFQDFMFPTRFDVLAAIRAFKPTSIYFLAKLLQRHYQSVLKDCNALEVAGFILTEKKTGERNQTVPSLAFDYDTIIVHNLEMGKMSHSLPSKAA